MAVKSGSNRFDLGIDFPIDDIKFNFIKKRAKSKPARATSAASGSVESRGLSGSKSKIAGPLNAPTQMMKIYSSYINTNKSNLNVLTSDEELENVDPEGPGKKRKWIDKASVEAVDSFLLFGSKKHKKDKKKTLAS